MCGIVCDSLAALHHIFRQIQRDHPFGILFCKPKKGEGFYDTFTCELVAVETSSRASPAASLCTCRGARSGTPCTSRLGLPPFKFAALLVQKASNTVSSRCLRLPLPSQKHSTE